MSVILALIAAGSEDLAATAPRNAMKTLSNASAVKAENVTPVCALA